MWQKPIHIPWAEVVDSKASRVKCTTTSPLTLSISVGIAKRSEADGAGNLSRLAKQPRSGLAFTGWEATQRSVVGVQGCRRRRLHPCHVANAGVGSAHGFDKLPRGRVAGGRCAKGTHFRGYSFIATNGFGTKCSEYTDAACGAKARQLANSPTGYLTIFQMLVQGLSMPLS